MHRLLVLALLASGLGLVPMSASAAASTVLAGYGDILADEARGQVFVSQGAKGGVVVTDLQGQVVTTIDSLVGAFDLELTPSGESVVVGLRDDHKVATIDTSTFEVEEWSVGTACPDTVGAASDDMIWFGSVCGSSLYGGMAGLHRADGTITDVSGWLSRAPACLLYTSDAADE